MCLCALCENKRKFLEKIGRNFYSSKSIVLIPWYRSYNVCIHRLTMPEVTHLACCMAYILAILTVTNSYFLFFCSLLPITVLMSSMPARMVTHLKNCPRDESTIAEWSIVMVIGRVYCEKCMSPYCRSNPCHTNIQLLQLIYKWCARQW